MINLELSVEQAQFLHNVIDHYEDYADKEHDSLPASHVEEKRTIEIEMDDCRTMRKCLVDSIKENLYNNFLNKENKDEK